MLRTEFNGDDVEVVPTIDGVDCHGEGLGLAEAWSLRSDVRVDRA